MKARLESDKVHADSIFSVYFRAEYKITESLHKMCSAVDIMSL